MSGQFKLISIYALFLILLFGNCNEPIPPDNGEPFWHYYEGPVGGDWFGLDHYDADSVWVAGIRDNGSGMTMEFDGISLKGRTPPVGTDELRDCCVQAVDNVWFVGVDDTVYRWRGDAFDTWAAPAGNLNAVDMGASDFGFAVGDDGIILSFDGSSWNPAESPTTADLNAVEFVSADEAWAVGDAGTVLRYNAGDWRVITPFTTADLHDTWFVMPDDGWFVGSSGAVYHYDGSGWTAYEVPNPDVNFYCAAFPTSVKGWVGGDNTTLLRFNDGAFNRVGGLPTGPWELRAMTAPTGDKAWAVGPGTILYYK